MIAVTYVVTTRFPSPGCGPRSEPCPTSSPVFKVSRKQESRRTSLYTNPNSVRPMWLQESGRWTRFDRDGNNLELYSRRRSGWRINIGPPVGVGLLGRIDTSFRVGGRWHLLFIYVQQNSEIQTTIKNYIVIYSLSHPFDLTGRSVSLPRLCTTTPVIVHLIDIDIPSSGEYWKWQILKT